MQKQKLNLVENSINASGNYTKPEFLKLFWKHTKEEIKELAKAELKIVQELITIELEGWNYWKLKEITLKKIINE